MDVLQLRAVLDLDLSGFQKKLKDAQSQMNGAAKAIKDSAKGIEDSSKGASGISKLGGALSSAGNKAAELVGKLGKVGAAAAGSAATGIAAFSKMALSSYGEYEQLVGGVDTLFKNSSKKVQEYADKAYQTAGMSANDYMETVTSFSASLLQSLGGNTSKAADYADMAIVDMSDNANKMGTAMDSIKNAYQGFAKQNYTMLDNLKLGYGGTKSEMERLLKDAEKLSGKKYDISNYGDVVEAIHEIQQEMGITNTTAMEAGKTIEGSAGSMKAAFDNVVTAIGRGEGIDKAGKAFAASLEANLNNVVPRIQSIMDNIGKVVEQAAPAISKALPKIIKELLPAITKSAGTLIKALGKGLVDSVPALLESVRTLVDSVFDELVKFRDNTSGVFQPLVGSIVELLSDIDIEFYDIKNGLQESLSGVDTTIILESLEKLVDALGRIVTVVGEGIGGVLAAIDWNGVLEGLSGIIDIISSIGDTAGEGLKWFLDNVAVPLVGWATESVIPQAIEGIQGALSILGQVIDAIKPALTTLWEKFLQPMWQLVGGAVATAIDGICTSLSALGEVDLSGFITDITSGGNFFEDWALGIDEIKKWFTTTGPEAIDGFFEKLGPWGEEWNSFWQSVGGEAIDNWAVGMDEIMGWFDTWKTGLDSIVGAVKEWADNWSTGIGEIKSKWTEFKDNFSLGWEEIKKTISELPSKALQWGKDLVSNFAEGITGSDNTVVEALEKLGEKVYDLLHHSTPEKGPLKDDDEWGYDFMDNFIVGIKGKQGELQKAALQTAGVLATAGDVSTPAITASLGSGQYGGSSGVVIESISINVNEASGDLQEIGTLVVDKINEALEKRKRSVNYGLGVV